MTLPAIISGHTTVQDASATTSRSISAPTHSNGDYILIALTTSTATNPAVAISGFTPLYDAATLSGGAVYLIYKKAASEPGSYTISSASCIVSAIAVAVSNFGGIHAQGTNATGTSATATAPAVTTTVADCLRISLIATDDSPGVTSVATLSTHTLLATVTGSSKPTISLQHKNLTSAGTDGSQTAALSGSETWTGVTFAISSTNEERVTKAGAYLELSGAAVQVTKAGAYLEILLNQIRVTKAGAYLEIIASQKVRATALGAYIELAPVVANDYVRATALGAYVELVSATPATPTLLTATAVGFSQIDLAWVDNATGETAYIVERSPNGSTGWTVIATIAANSVSYANTGLAYATTYYYRVAAVTLGVQSAYSNIASATTAAPAPDSGGSADTQFVVEVATRAGSSRPWDSGVAVTVGWYGSQAQGGYEQAELVASAGTPALLWGLLRFLGDYVTIRNSERSAVWCGLVDEITLELGNVQVGLSLSNMFNRIAVAYTTTDAGGATIRATTAWVEDAESIARYGYKELLYTMADASAEQAEAQRDTLLAAVSKPTPIVRIIRTEQIGGRLRCSGLFSTLAWRYYEQPAGLEEHTEGAGEQHLGQGLTDDTIGFTADGRLHDLSSRLGTLASGHKVQVSGSTSNNGAYLLDGSGQDGEVYTAATIFFDPTDDLHDSTGDLGYLSGDDIIEIAGSSSNDGLWRVKQGGSDHVTLAPSSIVTEAAGATITITQAGSVPTTSVFTNELPGATVTLTVHGVKIAQSFSLAADSDWTLNKAAVRIRKEGAPVDAVKVELCADSSGAPGTVLDSATVAATAIGTRTNWVEFDLANTQTLNYGTTYWLVISRTGSNAIADYYVVDVDEEVGYPRGALKVWTGSAWTDRATNADLLFRLVGAWETTYQVEAIYNACGQFFAGLDIVDSSGIYAAQHRVGDTNGLDEALPLLNAGSGTGRLLATVTPEKILRVRAQGAPSNNDLLLGNDGRLRNAAGQGLAPGRLPAGQWVRLADVPANVDALAHLANIFIERSEFHAAEDALQVEAQGEASPWDIGRTPLQELSRQANDLKPYITMWG